MKNILLALMLLAASSAQAAEVKKLSATSHSWDGAAIAYPQGKPLVTAIKLSFPPGDKMPFHCHPFPIVGYMLQGELEVEKMNGEKHTFKQGETITEVVNTWHRGMNHSKDEAVELVGFYTGVEGVEPTIYYSEATKDKCK